MKILGLVIAAGVSLLAGAAAAADIPAGRYECWNNGRARMLFNFEVVGPGRYRDGEGASGRFEFLDERDVRFTGGVHDGRVGHYHPGPPPDVSFGTEQDGLAALCQRVN